MEYVLCFFAVICLFFLIVMIVDVNRFVIVSYTITSKKIKKEGRFVVLSDLHNKQFGEKNKKLLEAIRKCRPDGILIAGDMITAKKEKDTKETVEFLGALSKEFPIYYGQGNHEYRLELYPEVYEEMNREFQEGLESHGIHILKNENVFLSEYGIHIYGLELDRGYYKRFQVKAMEEYYLEARLGRVNAEQFNVLLAHNPDYFPQYAEWGADLVLSGHVHGGLMRLPFLGGVVSPAIRLFPKYDGGIFGEKESKMILSRGLGTHTLPIRIFNPGELIVVTLK